MSNMNQRGSALELQVAKWNAQNPIGTEVHVKLDSGQVRRTKTRTEAQVLGGHSAVIWLEDIAGCYALNRVAPV